MNPFEHGLRNAQRNISSLVPRTPFTYHCGYGETIPWYNPIGVPIYTAVADGVNALSSCTSTYDNVSSAFYNNWASANTAIATVDKYGNHTGVAQGSTTSQTQGSIASPKIRVCPLLLRIPSGGVNVQLPTSLRVVSSQVIDMNTYGCAGAPYGIVIATQYQVLDNLGNPMKSTAMLPQEEITNIVFNGAPQVPEYPTWHNIGPTVYPGTSTNTDVNGQFIDAPFGVCTTGVFTETSQQKISMLFNGTNYVVRTSQWTITGTSAGHGAVSNDTKDVNLSH